VIQFSQDRIDRAVPGIACAAEKRGQTSRRLPLAQIGRHGDEIWPSGLVRLPVVTERLQHR